MYKGIQITNLEFYNSLFESEEFTSYLGKATLASGKLEVELIHFLKRKNINLKSEKSSLGMLIQIVEENKLLDQNAIETLKLLKTQRNYLIHNIYGLFSDLKEQTILEKKDLIDTDVESFIDKVWLLNENLINVSKIIQES